MTSKNASLIILFALTGIMTATLLAAALSATAGTANAQSTNNTTQSNATMISVGRGNLTVSYNQFFPQQTEINAGENVTFFNPTAEIHNVIIPLDNETISDIVLPFSMTPTPEFELLPPYNLGEPMVAPGPNGTQVLVTLNKVAFVPSIVDSEGNIEYLNGTDVSYSITGDEGTISSGIILATEEELEAMFMQAFPEEMHEDEEHVGNVTDLEESQNATETEEEQGGPPLENVNRFTATFEEPGTYEYFCAFHPGMFGQITVN